MSRQNQRVESHLREARFRVQDIARASVQDWCETFELPVAYATMKDNRLHIQTRRELEISAAPSDECSFPPTRSYSRCWLSPKWKYHLGVFPIHLSWTGDRNVFRAGRTVRRKRANSRMLGTCARKAAGFHRD